MKNKILIGMLIITFGLLNAATDSEKAASSGPQCYCSVKCGPRDPNQPGDNPKIDPEIGICFCQERDRILYKPNNCALKENAFNFESVCGQKAEEQE